MLKKIRQKVSKHQLHLRERKKTREDILNPLQVQVHLAQVRVRVQVIHKIDQGKKRNQRIRNFIKIT